MKSPNPLIPQGSQQNLDRGKANVKVFVFTILAVHVVLLGGLLNQGCKPPREGDQASLNNSAMEEFPPLDTTFGSPLSTNMLEDEEFYTSPPNPNGMNFDDDDPVSELGNLPRNTPAPVSNDIESPSADREENTNPGASNNVPERVNIPEREVAVAPDPANLPQQEFIEHTVVGGDSFYKIGQTYNVNFKDVMAANASVPPDGLQPGMKIKVPRSSTRNATNSTDSASTDVTNGKTYTVKRGDNLTKIASSQGTTILALKQANNLSGDLIRIGQQLTIPSGN